MLRSTSWALSARFAGQVYAFAGSIAAARFLGPDAMGRLTYIVFVQITLIVGLQAGLPMALTRWISEALGRNAHRDVEVLMRWGWRAAGAASAIVAATLAAIGLLGGEPRGAWYAVALGGAATVINNVPGSFLMGAQRWRVLSTVSVTTGAVAMAVKIAVLVRGGGITSLLVIDAASATLNFVIRAVLTRRAQHEPPPSESATPHIVRQLVRFSALSSLFVLLYYVVETRTEVFFLHLYSTDAQIAIYSIPFSIVTALLIFPEGLAAVMTPAFTTLHGAGETARMRVGFGRAVRLTISCSLAITAMSLALGPTLLRLVYGSRYAATADVMRILLLSALIYPIAQISIGALLALGRQWPAIVVVAVASAANIVADVLLIPRFDAVGAAAANSLAQFVSGVPIVVFATKAMGGIRWHIRSLVRSGVAAAAGGAAAFLVLSELPDLPGLILGTVVAVVTYALGTFAFKVLSAEDGAWLAETFGGAFGGHAGRIVRLASARFADGNYD